MLVEVKNILLSNDQTTKIFTTTCSPLQSASPPLSRPSPSLQRPRPCQLSGQTLHRKSTHCHQGSWSRAARPSSRVNTVHPRDQLSRGRGEQLHSAGVHFQSAKGKGDAAGHLDGQIWPLVQRQRASSTLSGPAAGWMTVSTGRARVNGCTSMVRLQHLVSCNETESHRVIIAQ